jgi:signal transduction histidine kinase/ligand-binding sensor domain-containing protein/CheY-like chemotaxis protein
MRLSPGSTALSKDAYSLRCAATALAVAAAFSAPVRAQHYHVHTYTEGDGLPSSTVHGMTQDPSGRMWFATRAGVAAYDGMEWRTFTQTDGLGIENWRRIAVDGGGRVWVAGERFRVARFEGDRWIPVPRPDLEPICDLNDLAVTGAGRESRVGLGTSCGLTLWNGERWRRLGLEHELPDTRVHSLEHLGDRWYVGTPEGLSVLHPGADSFVAPDADLPGGPVLGLADDICGAMPCLWIVGPDWIGRLERDGFRLLAEGIELAGANEPRAAEADGAGGLFVGNPRALYRYHPERGLESLDERNGLIAGAAGDIFRDREHNVWVATTRGVSKMLGFRFATLREEHGLHEDEVTAVLERSDGGFVLGHRSGLTLVDSDAGVGSIRPLRLHEMARVEPGMGRVLDLAEDATGTIWIAGNEVGLGCLEMNGVRWLRLASERRVNSVLADRERRLWVATMHHIYARRDGVFERVSPDSGFEHGVRRLAEGPDGSIYALGAGGGVHRYAGGRWERWAHPQRDDVNSVFSLLVRADGIHWVGTAAGLAVARDGELRPSGSPVIERPVYFMVADRRDRVWFGTDNGVMRWDGTRLEHFTVEHGLGGRETNRAAGLVDSRGRLWIGTTHGVTLYREELDDRAPVPPIVSLQGLEASGETVPLDGTIRLGHRRNDLVFSYRAVSFRDERNVRLQTWLEGYSPAWSESPAGRSIRFTNLPTGTYRLHIRAGNSDGSWSETVASPEIVIAPPLWGRPWVWVVTAAAVLLLIFAAQRHWVQRRYARRLETEVEQRVDELRRAEAELAKAQRLEALGLLAAGIAHDFNNLLMVILGNLSVIADRTGDRARKWIADAETAIQRASQLTGQLLTFARGGAPVLHQARIDDIVRESAEFVLRGSKVRAELDLASDLKAVVIDTGQISQVLNNLLINAMQAMPDGGVIRISGRNVHGIPGKAGSTPFVAIAVRDSGGGIPAHNLPRIFDPYFSTKDQGSGLGLTTAYSIANRHGGLLTAASEAGLGSTFTLYLPVSTRPADPISEIDADPDDLCGISVLVMDDDDAVREAVAAMLTGLGCAVTVAADGDEALRRYVEARANGRPFDVVILDLTVPGGMGGERTLQCLLRIDPEARAIVASGYANAPVMSEYRERGFKAVLRKPFRREEIMRSLRQVVGVRVGSRLGT